MSDALARGLDRVAAITERLHHSRAARLIFIALLAASALSLMLARPGQVENQIVREATPAEIGISSLGTYVRVTGILDVNGAYRTQYRLGIIQLQGGRYIPLTVPDSFSAVYVLDEGVPSHTPGEFVTIVGQVVPGVGAQPTVFIQPGYPPDVVLAQTVARVGGVALAMLIGLALLGGGIRRLDYALPAPSGASTTAHDAPDLLWFGSLGREYDDAIVRSAAVTFQATPFEGRLSGSDWHVPIRRLRLAHLFTLATRWGSLPAARVWFEDNRGLHRRGVIAARRADVLDAVLQVLSRMR